MAWGVPKIGADVIDATGNFDLIEPVGVAQGDLMVACIAYKGNAAITAPSGWSAPAELVQNSGDTDATDGIASGVMFYIVRGSSAPSLTCTRTAGDTAYAKIISYSGCHTAPYDTGSSATQGAAGATPTTATFNTATPGELIVSFAAYGDQYTASAFDAATDPTTASGATDTTTAPTNGTWIERFDANTNTGADTGIGIADAVRAAAGATGTIQATISSASGRNVLVAAAFKLAATTISAANLTSGTDADGGSGSTTASITPTANRLALLSITSRTNITADPNIPTATGWTLVDSIVWDSDSASRKRTTVLRSMGLSSGTVAIDFGGQNQTNVAWCIDEFAGVDTSGTNGSGAVVQAVTNKDEVSGGGTLTVTLAAFGSTSNATYGAFGADFSATGCTAGAGFAELASANSSVENMSEFRGDNDTTVTCVFETAAGFKCGGVAIELKASTGTTIISRLGLLGVG